MAPAAPPGSAAGARTLVVDADSHVMEPADLWQERLEPRYRDRAIRIVEVDGVEQLIMGEQVVLAGTLAGLGGVHRDRMDLFAGGLRYVDGCPPASYDPDERVRLYDEWGVDAGVVFPTIGILPFPCEDNELTSAYCRAYNRWQADFAAGARGRVLPIAHLNLGDLDEARRELQWCLDQGFKGVFLPPEPVGVNRPGEAHFDPLWRMCAEAGVPACIHVVVRFGGAAVPYAAWHQAGAGLLFGFALGAPGQIIPTVASMVLDGVFDRVPELKVLCVEAGAGWAGHLMDRLDEKHSVFGAMAPPLELKPSDYLRRNVWYVAEPEERTIGAMLDIVGEDRILWGSDFPHIDSTLEAPHLIRRQLEDLSPTRRSAVLGGNAAKLFGLS
ncbi:MAG TPA: amidohydrolase family protein [Acidimicrobiales bacterium]|nr:amidohydrolase family protein [Acidimicrobiales bacterium]